MTTYPLPTLAPTISATGISVPSYYDVLSSLQASYRAIFGSDVDLSADTQDGQWLAVQALAIYNQNLAIVAVYQAYSPTFAQGVGLSSVVKINGIRRQVASRSTAVVTLVGQVGTIITGGLISDQDQTHLWELPASVVIPLSGEIDVTATCIDEGDVVALAGTLTYIATPTRGWQSVTNAAEATTGAPVESDAQLRQRQTVSTGLPAQSVFTAIVGAVKNVPGVIRATGYENDTGATDGNGIPGHSISIVVEGGDVNTVAETIFNKKTPGTGTYGTTEVTVFDQYGIPNVMKFFELVTVDIYVTVTIEPLTGYVSTTADEIKAALVAWLNSLDIGEDVYYTKLFGPANLSNSALGQTYDITALTLGTAPTPIGTSNVTIAFNEAALSSLDKIVVEIAP